MNYLRGSRVAMSAAILLSVLLSVAAYGAKNPYLVGRFLDNGQLIDKIIVPGRPPAVKAAVAQVPEPNIAAAINVLSGVPAFTWCYGCSATSAAMMMGYYDRNGYSNMYAGPANSGVCPLNNVTYWGTSPHPGGSGECPLSATHQGKDGRTGRGNVDDYWIDYLNAGPDPWVGNWAEHTYGECTADYMGTNQSSVGNVDGSTTFYCPTNGAPLSNYTGCEPSGRDGCHGMKDFVVSRGYTVTANFSQYIYPNPEYPGNTQGFTYANFRTEIDAGRPVMIQVEGHSMVGYGYDDSTSLIYIHDTWDNSNHSMTWGGSYSGMLHYGVTVLRLTPRVEPPVELVHLLYPSDSGVTMERGKSYVVQWETLSEELTAKTPMKITLRDGDGHSWILAPSVPNTGFWIWKSVGAWKSKTQAAYLDGDLYLIIVGTADNSASDMSDSPFAIGTVTSLTVNGPTPIVGGALSLPQYSCAGHLNFGDDQDVTPSVKWLCTKIKGVKMGKTGLLATVPVLTDTPCDISATYGKGKPPITATPLHITITPPGP